MLTCGVKDGFAASIGKVLQLWSPFCTVPWNNPVDVSGSPKPEHQEAIRVLN
jgi:hypothetical protein